MCYDQKVIIITAPSGTGKTTISHYLLKQLEDLEFSISATNRERREDEEDGVDYYFYTTEEFEDLVEEGSLVEWEEVYEGQYYGTPYSELERAEREGKVLLFDIDVNGAIHLKEKFGDNALAIFISPPSFEELKKRLEQRDTETEDSLKKRLKRASYEMSREKEFDIIIVNDDLAQAKLKTLKAIKSFLP